MASSNGEINSGVANLECPFNWDIGNGSLIEKCVIGDLEKLTRKRDFTVVSRCVLATIHANNEQYNKALDILKNQQWEDLGSSWPERRQACKYITGATELIIQKKLQKIGIEGIQQHLTELNDIWSSKDMVRACIFFMKGIALSNFGTRRRKEAAVAFQNALSELDFHLRRTNDNTLELHREVSHYLGQWEHCKDHWFEDASGSFCEPMNFPRQAAAQRSAFQASRFRKKMEKYVFFRGLLPKSRPEDFFDFQGKSKSQGIHIEGSALTIATLPSTFKLFVGKKKKEYLSCDQDGEEKRRLYTEVFISEQLLQRFQKAVPKLSKWQEIRQRSIEIDACSNVFCAEMLRHMNELFNNNAVLYYRLATLYPYDIQHENQRGIKYLKRAKKEARNCSGSIWIDLELINRKSMSRTEDWVRNEYQRLHEASAGDDNLLARIKLKMSQWLLNLASHPGTNFFLCLGEAVNQLEQARQLDDQLVFPSTFLSYLGKLLTSNRFDRPELYAWYCSAFNPSALSPENILENHQRVMLGDETVSNSRKFFAIEQIGFLLMQQDRFQEAYNMFSELPDSNSRRKRLITRAVLEDFDHDNDLLKPSNSEIDNCLLQCLKFGNCDVIERILIKWDLRKGSSQLKSQIFEDNYFEQDHSDLFFSTECYDVCATIENTLEHPNGTFFLDKGKSLDDDFIRTVKNRISVLLDIPSDRPETMNDLWRKRRLEMTKMFLYLGRDDHNEWTNNEIYGLNMKILDTLRDSRNSLDQTITQALRLKDNCSFPLIHKKLNKFETIEFNKKLKDKKVTEEDRTAFREERMKEWLRRAVVEQNGHLGNTSDPTDDSEFVTNEQHDHQNVQDIEAPSTSSDLISMGSSPDLHAKSSNFEESASNLPSEDPCHSATSINMGKKKKNQKNFNRQQNTETGNVPQGKPERNLFEVIKGLAIIAFEGKVNQKNKKFKVLTRREHYLITKQSAWHCVWLDFVNSDKHAEPGDISELEKKLNAFRKITSDTNSYMMAYEIAHLAAIFAEETRVLFSD